MTQRYDLLPEAAQRLACVPRTGRLLARLPAAAYDTLKTDTDVYWKVYTFQTRDGTGDCGLLADGLKTPEARRLGWHDPSEPVVSEDFRAAQVRRAADLLGAIAFEMMATATGPVHAVEDDYTGFRTRVFARFPNKCSNAVTKAYLGADWDCLLKMDSHGLKHFIFSTDSRDQQLRWTDVTTMAFFAAYWACRWADDKDRALMRTWVIDPLAETNKTFREFWTFAAEMPDEAIERRRDRWQALFAPLYDGSLVDEEAQPIRSTEFIYRTWDRMVGTAAHAKFLAEFNNIRTGKQATKKKRSAAAKKKNAEQQRIAGQLLNGFISLVNSAKPDDTGAFTMGAPPDEHRDDTVMGARLNPLHVVTLSPFRLHKFCVTNLEYELFDPRHRRLRWETFDRHPLVDNFYDRTADDSCPVVMVAWYDAWCFARWVAEVEIEEARYGITLPTEAQWEYACRAGRKTPFTFHEGHKGLMCTTKVCNFDGDFFEEGARDGTYYRFTVPVAGLKKDRFRPNRWGFWQMHGNVIEWCQDWHSFEFYDTSEGNRIPNPENTMPSYARVCRGGCWNSSADECRSAFRDWCVPDRLNYGRGFRLAAVPVVGAESSK